MPRRILLALFALSFLTGVLLASQQATVYTFTRIDVPFSALGAAPLAINDRGQIIGVYSDSTGDHGFLCDTGVFTTIDVAFSGAFATTAFGINNRGQIVGRYLDSCCVHGFVYDGGLFTTIDVPSA